MNSAKENIDIISKLMNEEFSGSEVNSLYEKIYDYVHNGFATALDSGSYTDNSEIIREIDDILEQYSVFNAVNGLVEKNIVAIRGHRGELESLLGEKVFASHWWIEYNTNTPMIILQNGGCDKLYALTYVDKLVTLDQDEYRIITNEICKDNIDIRKLIKCFIVSTEYQYENLAFLLLPANVDDTNHTYVQLSKLYKEEYLVVDEDGIWKEIVDKKSGRKQSKRIVCLYNDNMHNAFSVKQFSKRLQCKRYSDFYKICHKKDRPIINFNFQSKLLNVIMAVEVYYSETLKKTSDSIEQLNKDSLMIEDENIKSMIIKYRKKLSLEIEQLRIGRAFYLSAKRRLLGMAKEYEKTLSKLLVYDIASDVDCNAYIDTLLELFFKYVKANDEGECKDSILKLDRANYKYTVACEAYYSYKMGREVSASTLYEIKGFPDERWEIAKIKVALFQLLQYSAEEAKSIVEYIGKHVDDGLEFFLMAQRQVDVRQYQVAKNYFLKAIDLDYPMAGHELIKLAKNHPECKISIYKLSEKMIPEANYEVGYRSMNTDGGYRMGIINLKIAASKEYLEAVVYIADLLFDRCKHIPWYSMEEEENINKVNNVIRLYEYLESKNINDTDTEEMYKLRIGLMYCKLKDYNRAYTYLKNSDSPEAQYQCAKMFQYGNGVARDLEMALKYYEKIDGEYKNTEEQIEKIRDQIQNESRYSDNTYSSDRSYTSTTHSYSSSTSSSFCFITTAACYALSSERDCDELNELRWFRDTHIIGNGDEGKALVDEYYRIGPEIVEHIDTDWNPFAIYEELWTDYIRPSCDCIKQNKWSEALNIYIMMVKKMCEMYSVPVRSSIKEKYCINVGTIDE